MAALFGGDLECQHPIRVGYFSGDVNNILICVNPWCMKRLGFECIATGELQPFPGNGVEVRLDGSYAVDRTAEMYRG